MGLKLYGLPMSTCTARVLFCLHEKGLEFEFVPVALFNKEHKKPDFLAKNPFGQVPVLEDGELVLFESRAITAYLAEKYKSSGTELSGEEKSKDSAMVKVWSEVESQQYNPIIYHIVYQHFVAPVLGKPSDKAVIEENLEKLKKVLDVYEARLSNAKYLAGDSYSLADLNHLPYTIYFMKTEWASLFCDRPHVKAWWDDISSRPASQKVAAGMSFDRK